MNLHILVPADSPQPEEVALLGVSFWMPKLLPQVPCWSLFWLLVFHSFTLIVTEGEGCNEGPLISQKLYLLYFPSAWPSACLTQIEQSSLCVHLSKTGQFGLCRYDGNTIVQSTFVDVSSAGQVVVTWPTNKHSKHYLLLATAAMTSVWIENKNTRMDKSLTTDWLNKQLPRNSPSPTNEELWLLITEHNIGHIVLKRNLFNFVLYGD